MKQEQTTKNTTTMKTTFTFAETSKIFAQVVKIEAAVEQYNEAHANHEEADARFDSEYAKFNYSFYNAPQELHEMFEEKLNSNKEEAKAALKVFKAVKEFGELIGIGEGYADICEERIKRFLNYRNTYGFDGLTDRVKHLAIDASKRINFNA